MLKTSSGGPGGATIKPADIVARGYDVDVKVDLKNSDGSVSHFNVDAGAELAKAAAERHPEDLDERTARVRNTGWSRRSTIIST